MDDLDPSLSGNVNNPGEQLRLARERMGMSLEQVSKETWGRRDSTNSIASLNLHKAHPIRQESMEGQNHARMYWMKDYQFYNTAITEFQKQVVPLMISLAIEFIMFNFALN